jgi:hypothetical protein
LGLACTVVEVAEHVHSASLCTSGFLDKLAGALVAEEGRPEGCCGVGLVVLAHHLLDVDGGFTGVVEGDGRDEMMADVGANDVVEEMGVDEAEVSVDGCGGTTSKGPGLVVVVRHGSVGVLEEGNGDCGRVSV